MLKKHPPKRSDDALEQKPKHEGKNHARRERNGTGRKKKKNTKIKKTEQTELKIEGVKHKDERCRKYIRNKTKTKKKVHTNRTEKEM